MGLKNIINQEMDKYSQQVYGPEGVAFNSPNTFQYHIDANDAAAAVPSNVIKEAIPGFGGETLGLLSDVAMPALALGSSPFYDAYQGITRVNDQFKGAPPGYAPTFSDYAKGVWDEDIGKSMIGRTLGTGQNLVRNAKDYGTGIMEALNPSKQTVIDRINAANNLSPMGTDVIGMDEMNTYGQVPMGTDVIGMDEMNTYGQVPVENQFNIHGVHPSAFDPYGNKQMELEKDDVLSGAALQSPKGLAALFQNLDPSSWGKALKTKAKTGWNLAQKLPGMAMGAMSKIPGIGMALGALGNSFEDRQLTGDGTIVDEYGRSYTADELNSQNALGGWYTDAARSSRRRNKSVQKMLDRQKKESLSRLGAKRLAKLQAQQALENANRLSATKTLAAQNKAAGTGGYQSSFGKDAGFMGGSGTSADMGSFRDGGLATLFTRRG